LIKVTKKSAVVAILTQIQRKCGMKLPNSEIRKFECSQYCEHSNN